MNINNIMIIYTYECWYVVARMLWFSWCIFQFRMWPSSFLAWSIFKKTKTSTTASRNLAESNPIFFNLNTKSHYIGQSFRHVHFYKSWRVIPQPSRSTDRGRIYGNPIESQMRQKRPQKRRPCVARLSALSTTPLAAATNDFRRGLGGVLGQGPWRDRTLNLN